MAVRLAISEGLLRGTMSFVFIDAKLGPTYYHEPITYMVPLYKLASIKPWKKRTAQSCSYDLHAAEHMVRPDQRMRVSGSQMLGRSFWMIRP
jgi:hypothetical protein